jgi:hypothetical protein
MVGGSLGVAILGSLLSAGYHTAIDGTAAVAQLPASAGAAARDSLGGAVEVAAQLGGTSGQSLLDDARQAFVHAMGNAVLVGAAVALVGAIVALIWLPARAAAPAEATAPPEPVTTRSNGARPVAPDQGDRDRELAAVTGGHADGPSHDLQPKA